MGWNRPRPKAMAVMMVETSKWYRLPERGKKVNCLVAKCTFHVYAFLWPLVYRKLI
jgi:hypothetical protein